MRKEIPTPQSQDGSSSAGKKFSSSTVTVGEEMIFKLNIGGRPYCFRTDTVLLCREQNSLLARLIRATHSKRLIFTDAYSERENEYYIERNSKVAEYVIDYFLTGKLHKPTECCWERFREEMRFWRIAEVELAPCCSILADTSRLNKCLETEQKLQEVNFSEIRKIIWHLMENPSSSIFAKIYSFLSVLFIFSSIAGLVAGSMPEFQCDNRNAEVYHLLLNTRKAYHGGPASELPLFVPGLLSNETLELVKNFVYRPTDDPQFWLIVVEYICICWFTVEYSLRLVVAPQKWKFFKCPTNLIDLFTILPFYLEMSLSTLGLNVERLKDFTGAMLVIRVLRVVRSGFS